MASNDYKRQWMREHRDYLKSTGQYYGSGYDGNSRRNTATDVVGSNNAGKKQEWTPSKINEYRVTFNDDTPNQIVKATSAKAAREIAAAEFGAKKIKDVKNVKNTR